MTIHVAIRTPEGIIYKDVEPEPVELVRHVRTEAGVEKFDQPIGSVITADQLDTKEKVFAHIKADHPKWVTSETESESYGELAMHHSSMHNSVNTYTHSHPPEVHAQADQAFAEATSHIDTKEHLISHLSGRHHSIYWDYGGPNASEYTYAALANGHARYHLDHPADDKYHSHPPEQLNSAIEAYKQQKAARIPDKELSAIAAIKARESDANHTTASNEAWHNGGGEVADFTAEEKDIAAAFMQDGEKNEHANDMLREGGGETVADNEFNDPDTAPYAALIRRSAPFTKKTTVFRGILEPADLFGPTGSMIGKVFKDDGFVSTTPDRKTAQAYGGDDEGAMISITFPPGTRALKSQAAFFGDSETWREFTLPPGTQFKVTGDEEASNGIRKIKLTVIPPGETAKESITAPIKEAEAPKQAITTEEAFKQYEEGKLSGSELQVAAAKNGDLVRVRGSEAWLLGSEVKKVSPSKAKSDEELSALAAKLQADEKARIEAENKARFPAGANQTFSDIKPTVQPKNEAPKPLPDTAKTHAQLLKERTAARAKYPPGSPQRLLAERAVRQSRKAGGNK